MSRREFVSRFYRNEDDYTKQIENSLKGGDSYLSDEITFETKNVQPKQDVYTQIPNKPTLFEGSRTYVLTPVISIESPGYIQTSFKDQTPKQQGCGLCYALKRIKNKVICKSKSSLDETFAYDPYKSLTASSKI